ncbi:hypothetical protein [Streptomyces sp. NBC_01751]|uniref:hypothetical protein n=1 Tax=Streptomyces sp. NBC_01751 TaxID=2975929 RepID=UPI002DD7C920|nr:hypothetical protein [Streptomyces sp. NBC_01751]WSD25218.1 hypothetical protein OHA26_17940 [Streptomyces sp. NBC_01751]
MYGPGHPPPPTPMPPRRLPSRAWIVSMRVLFVVLSVGSIGLLLWAPLLRLAIVRRRTSDWWLTGAGFVFVCVLLPIIGRDGSNADANGIDFVLIPMLLLAMLGAPVYYLVADIRHYEQLEKQPFVGGYLPPVPGYGYTTVPVQQPRPAQPQQHQPQQYQQHQPPRYQPAHPQPAHPQSSHPQSSHAQPAHPQPAHPQSSQPQPAPTPPHRIDQVRAELDELSDYLRKEEDR